MTQLARTTIRSSAVLAILLGPLAAPGIAVAEDAPVPPCAPYSTRLSAMTGLAQDVMLGGGNLAFELKIGRFAFEASHGQALDLNRAGGLSLTKSEKAAGVEVFVPWTTGVGLGVQITPALHVLLELKAHHYRVRGVDRNEQSTYTTYSVGPGVFYTIRLSGGLFIEPAIRFWPNVASSLGANRPAFRSADGSEYHHQPHSFDLFPNLNVGWTFTGV